MKVLVSWSLKYTQGHGPRLESSFSCRTLSKSPLVALCLGTYNLH
jgi:hypothetical protein